MQSQISAPAMLVGMEKSVIRKHWIVVNMVNWILFLTSAGLIKFA